jgi:hypothetical protein
MKKLMMALAAGILSVAFAGAYAGEAAGDMKKSDSGMKKSEKGMAKKDDAMTKEDDAAKKKGKKAEATK